MCAYACNRSYDDFARGDVDNAETGREFAETNVEQSGESEGCVRGEFWKDEAGFLRGAQQGARKGQFNYGKARKSWRSAGLTRASSSRGLIEKTSAR